MQDYNTYTVSIKCDACGRKHTFVLHALIDTGADRYAESKVLSGEYFETTCPFCHQVESLVYTCAYHDRSRKLLILLADDDASYKEIQKIVDGTYQDSPLYKAIHDWLKDCTVRIVRNVNALQEKVLIAHYGLDDRVIECARHELTSLLCERRKDIIHLYFDMDRNDQTSFMIETDKGIEESLPFSKEEYQKYEDDYAQYFSKFDSFEIDAEWAAHVYACK